MKRFDETRAVLIKDIERCPYVPKDPEYDEWSRKDRERIRLIIEERKKLFDTAILVDDEAIALITGKKPLENIRDMAKFIIDFFGVD